MTDNIYHYIAPLPIGIDETIMPCIDGYTIYTADRLSTAERRIAYKHALEHIVRDDWSKDSVQAIESEMTKPPIFSEGR